MAWSDNTRNNVLVACGRHCCICHRFVGLKIELHHIKLKSEGGNDDEDNCIALCFECHADMTSYDHKHPKGSKYTVKELKLHRDNWYSKIAKPNINGNDRYDPKVDSELYYRIRNDLPINVIEFFRNHHFGHVFMVKDAEFVYNFADKPVRPDDEFIDPEIEALRAALHSSVREFAEILSHNTWLDNRDRSFASVPSEWKSTQYERHLDVISKLSAAADAVGASYDALARAAVRKLGIRLTS